MAGWVVGKLESNAKLNSKLRLKLKLELSLAKEPASVSSIKILAHDALMWGSLSSVCQVSLY